MLLIIQQLPSSISCKRALSRSCLPPLIPFHSFISSRGIVMLLSSTHHLVLSRSCSFIAYPFKWRVVSIIPVLTGVSSKCFHFAKFIFLPFISNRSVFNLVHLRCILFSKLFNLSRMIGFTCLSKKQLCFTSSFSIFSPVPSYISGRDPLVVVECCNAPRPLRQVSSSYSLSLPCHFLACCILSCHHVHCIIMF